MLHRDPFAGSIRYHLGLVTPNSDACRIRVDGIPCSWRDGEAVLFDETYVREAPPPSRGAPIPQPARTLEGAPQRLR